VNASTPNGDRLDRRSVVPLYFQLQELLKEKIELGVWRQDEAIPPELELCTTYEVSRTVVRQALAILEQDGQITRTRGRGTFVSAPKVEQRAGGLSRLLSVPGPESDVTILDHRSQPAPRRIADQLELEAGGQILRVMSLLRIRGAPVALFDSFFPEADVDGLRRALPRRVPGRVTSPLPHGIALTRSSVAIETSFCSKWEAEQLQIPFHGAVFVTLITEYRRSRPQDRPFEVARAVYRVDRVQFHLEVASDGVAAQATWQLADAR
jgi:GntR family transcriptional regulator